MALYCMSVCVEGSYCLDFFSMCILKFLNSITSLNEKKLGNIMAWKKKCPCSFEIGKVNIPYRYYNVNHTPTMENCIYL